MGSQLVLVADDDPDLRQLLASALEGAGYRVVTAKDGNTAARIVTVARPAAVVTDVRMPAASGLELCELVRRNRDIAETVVVIVSAASQDHEVRAGFAAGANDYLVKPFSPRDLVRRVRELLEPAARLAEA
ncbi:MAG TPA: response regulator transcription factor [Pilimelia sp.]|nr:response regulator transcription factor [Pilimelia sp.]